MKYVWRSGNASAKAFVQKRKTDPLDFDGTLAPIARTPDAVTVDAEMQRILKTSAGQAYQACDHQRPPLKQLKGFLRLPKALYVGNHAGNARLSLPLRQREKSEKAEERDQTARSEIKMTSYLRGNFGGGQKFHFSLHFRNLLKSSTQISTIGAFLRDRYRLSAQWSVGKKVWRSSRASFGEKRLGCLLLKRFPVLPSRSEMTRRRAMFRALKNRGAAIVDIQKRQGGHYLLAVRRKIF